jgi:hypothetical protein
MSSPQSALKFRNIFILDSRAWLQSCREHYDPALDLVLTYDFALKQEVHAMGGRVCYVDHLLQTEVMQQNNFLAYEFFRRWHYDSEGRDFFTYRGVPFGSGLVVYFWGDYIFYVRVRLCLEKLRDWSYERLFVGTASSVVEATLAEMEVPYRATSPPSGPVPEAYYFPMQAWMDDNVEWRGLKAEVSAMLCHVLGVLLSWVDRARGQRRLRPAVFVQQYHPTLSVIRRLREDGRVRIVLTTVSKNFITTLSSLRYIPMLGKISRFVPAAQECMRRFRAERHSKLVVANGLDISQGAYAAIERNVSGRCAAVIRALDGIVRYLDRNPIALEIMISSGGVPNGLVHCAAKVRNVPSYLIVNGLMSGDFMDESKDATTINAYGDSIRENYFRGMDNIVCLGDPRMDAYPPTERRRPDAAGPLTVVIGASGFNNADLNSYVAVEFEFMFDVLKALEVVKRRGVRTRVVIKVRANGYLAQYREFAGEYFPGLVDEIVDRVPMKHVLSEADFYVSIYSQTLFEASCMGIPCVYYKKDEELLDPPFDENSELVTVSSVEGLVQAIDDLRAESARFDAFLRRSVMEKYIGPLDGHNLERNVEYAYGLLDAQARRTAALSLAAVE